MPSPFTATVLFHRCLFFSCLSAFLSSPAFILSVSFLLFSLTTSVSSLCPRTPALHQKENGKTANPTASYGIRVYQPIMPFSDLFSSQDRSLCACIPPPRRPTPFPYRPTKATDAVFSAAKPCAMLLHRHQPPPDCYGSKYAEGRLPTATRREREREMPVNAASPLPQTQD